MKYGIYLSGGRYGYNLLDMDNGNVDIDLIFEDNSIFSITLFTVSNIKRITESQKLTYFWSSDMVIVKNLKIESILTVVEQIVVRNYYKHIGTKIGYYGDEHHLPEYYDETNWLLRHI